MTAIKLIQSSILFFVFLNSIASNKYDKNISSLQIQSDKIEIENKFFYKVVATDSNSYAIKGQVYDSSLKQGLPMATIKVNNRNIICTSNANGFFVLKLPKKFSNKNFTIIASYVMYKPKKVRIENKKHLLEKTLIVYLQPRKVDLNEVVKTCCN
ncbi:MAG TPA: carboxypeptidase-like regulatory domain-containing protein [Parafilimonas sp.]|nr:carboxypeptidase-like regulatory domain-containing protein [Parafilimonas sp.]